MCRAAIRPAWNGPLPTTGGAAWKSVAARANGTVDQTCAGRIGTRAPSSSVVGLDGGQPDGAIVDELDGSQADRVDQHVAVQRERVVGSGRRRVSRPTRGRSFPSGAHGPM